MLDSSEVNLQIVYAHHIGNKLRQEGITLTTTPLVFGEDASAAVLNYFFNHFKSTEAIYKLTHPVGKEQNAVSAICGQAFAGNDLRDLSAKAAAHLYDVSDHPRINRGDLFVAKFTGLKFQGKSADAIGFFKSDRKERFLSLKFEHDRADLSVSSGADLKSFDKGAIVFNLRSSDGYRVIQATSQSEDTAYWTERFLKLALVTKESLHTEQVLRLCKKYSDSLADEDDPSRQVQFLDATHAYFAKNSHFRAEDFEAALPDGARESFTKFKDHYEQENKEPVPTDFKVVPSVLKRQRKIFRSVIKLDNHIEIKIDPMGDDEAERCIEKGYDKKKGQSFYKIYFNDER